MNIYSTNAEEVKTADSNLGNVINMADNPNKIENNQNKSILNNSQEKDKLQISNTIEDSKTNNDNISIEAIEVDDEKIDEDSIISKIDKTFEKLDVNKDKVIDETDISEASKNDFELSDKNNDGILSKDEFFERICNESCDNGECECKNYSNKEDLSYMKEYWNIIDSDKNGNISLQEKLQDDLNNFYLLDTDKDGKVYKEDLAAQFY